jgi:hypothetical protein
MQRHAEGSTKLEQMHTSPMVSWVSVIWGATTYVTIRLKDTDVNCQCRVKAC